MSLPLKPRRLPAEYNPRAIEDAIQDILTSMQGGFRYVILQEWTREPPRPQPNMTVMADGMSWDPGSGSGFYRWNQATASWIFLG